jgi:hypothetical protein
MKKPMGRPPKPEGEKYIIRSFACPPDLWDEVQQFIPPKERSQLIQGCLRREVAKQKRERGKEEGSAEGEGGD